MLFNSYIFIAAFLPVTFVLFWVTMRVSGPRAALMVLIPASLFFYAWWNPPYVLFLIGSILGNFACGRAIAARRAYSKPALWLGITFNLLAIGYFKYSGFFLENLNALHPTDLHVSEIFLPLGISFFTFQQITYLLDLHTRKIEPANFFDYSLFVSFFPQLIAGPIVHAREVIPQFINHPRFKHFMQHTALGSAIFIMGLFKKTFLADSLSAPANFIFSRAGAADHVEFFAAWLGALSYTFQLYFDFSGYSDMAIGLALLFGIRIPVNFLSPYKAANIADFWGRWHITMSRFFRDYIYIPLGGNRTSPPQHLVNLLITMFLAGLWHGAGWTFVIWGLLHGFYLAVHHVFASLRAKIFPNAGGGLLYKAFAALLTFIAVVVGWVFFRAADFATALKILKGMAGLNGVLLPDRLAGLLPFSTEGWLRIESGARNWLNDASYWWIPLVILGYGLCTALPASIEYFGVVTREKGPPRLKFAFTAPHAVFIAMLLVLSLFSMQKISEFLYFQF